MNRSLPRALVLIAVLVCLLLACKRKEQGGSGSVGDRAAKLKPDAKKRLEQLAALAPKVKAEAAVSSDKPVSVKLSRKTVAILGEQWLTDPNRSASSEELKFDNTLLSLCKHGTEGEPKSADDLRYLEDCVALETVAVVRQRSLERPRIKMKSKSYDSGQLKAAVLVFELATAKLLGAYDLHVSNDPELKLPAGDQSEKDWLGLAMADLVVNAQSKVEEKLGIKL